MPTIPIYNRNAMEDVNRAAPRLQGATPNPAAFGAANATSGRQLQQLGGAVQKAASVGAWVVNDYNNTVVEDAFNQYQKQNTELRAQLAQRQGQNALGGKDGTPSVVDSARQWSREARSKLGAQLNEVQRGRFAALAEQSDTQLMAWASAYQQRQFGEYQVTLAQGRMKTASESMAVTYGNDPDAFASAQEELKQAVQDLGAFNGWDESYTRQYYLDATGDALMPIAQQLISNGQLGRAREFMREHAPALGARRSLSLEAGIKAESRRLEAEARANAERARQAQVMESYQQILAASMQAGTFEDQKATALEAISQIEDFQERAAVHSYYTADMGILEQRYKAQNAQAVLQFETLTEKQGWTPSQALTELGGANIPEEAREKLRTRLEQRAAKETPENIMALNDLRVLIDKGEVSTNADIFAYTWDHGLTLQQAKSGMEYLQNGGNTNSLTQTEINQAAAALGLNVKKLSPNMYAMVAAQLKPGEKATFADVRKIMAEIRMDQLKGTTPDSGWIFDSETLAEAVRHNRADAWLPDLSSQEKKEIYAVLRAQGVPPTEEKARQYKKTYIMGITSEDAQ